MRIIILIADDHTLVREGLSSLFAAHANIDVMGAAPSGPEALHEVLRLRPGAVLMDVSVPELSAIEATRQLADCFPPVKAVLLSTHAAIEQYHLAVRAAGATC